MKSEDSKQSVKDLQSFASKLHKVGSRPRLSRRQKRHMLRQILPQRPLVFRLAPAFSAAFFTGLLVVSSVSFAAKPGDLLYSVKRKIEDARSVVQPSYDEQLLKRREDEIKNISASGNNEDKLNIANKEKQEIENRLREHEGSSNTQTQPVKTNDDTNTEAPSDTHRSGSEGAESSSSKSAKESCKLALEAREKAGENVSSDEYKKCDSL